MRKKWMGKLKSCGMRFQNKSQDGRKRSHNHPYKSTYNIFTSSFSHKITHSTYNDIIKLRSISWAACIFLWEHLSNNLKNAAEMEFINCMRKMKHPLVERCWKDYKKIHSFFPQEMMSSCIMSEFFKEVCEDENIMVWQQQYNFHIHEKHYNLR